MWLHRELAENSTAQGESRACNRSSVTRAMVQQRKRAAAAAAAGLRHHKHAATSVVHGGCRASTWESDDYTCIQ